MPGVVAEGGGIVAMDEARTRLERFIGEWTLLVTFPGAPPVAGGRVVFEWMTGQWFFKPVLETANSAWARLT
jgi:hypothetical protein